MIRLTSLISHVILTFLMPVTGFAFQAGTVPSKFSLEQAKAFAREHNPVLLNAQLDVEIARKKIWETASMGLPQVMAGGNFQYIFKVPEISFPTTTLTEDRQDGTISAANVAGDSIFLTMIPGDNIALGVQENFTWNVSLSQLIFSGEYLIGLKAMRALKEVTGKSLSKTTLDIDETVSQSYYLALMAEENLIIIRNNVSIVDKMLNDLTKMNEVGFVEKTDVDQMMINKAMLQNLYRSVESQKMVAYRLLKFQMGIDIDQPIELTDSLSLFRPENSLRFPGDSFDVTGNINYQMMETQEALSRLNVKRYKVRYLPVIAGFYTHQEQLNQSDFDFFMPDILGISISLPVFTSGQRLSQVSQARLELDKAAISKQQLGQSLLLAYDQSITEYNTALNNYFNNKSSRELSWKIYERTRIKFIEGVATSLDLTQAQNQYLNTEGEYYNALLEYLNAKMKLEKLTTVSNRSEY